MSAVKMRERVESPAGKSEVGRKSPLRVSCMGQTQAQTRHISVRTRCAQETPERTLSVSFRCLESFPSAASRLQQRRPVRVRTNSTAPTSIPEYEPGKQTPEREPKAINKKQNSARRKPVCTAVPATRETTPETKTKKKTSPASQHTCMISHRHKNSSHRHGPPTGGP